MKITTPLSARRAGFALLMVMIMAGLSIVLLAGAMYRNHTVATLNQRNNEYNTCANAAEAAVEKVYARMAYDFQSFGPAGPTNNLPMYRTNVPTAAEDSFWSKFIFTDGQSNVSRTYVSHAYSYAGPLPSAYSGLFTIPAPVYRIVSNVQLSNSNYQVTGTAQEDVLLAMVPLNTWAIFYNGLLEFSTCATMNVNGRVHANGAIYVGSGSPLTFSDGVSTTLTLTSPRNNGSGGWTTGNWNTTFNANPDYATNVASVTVSLGMTNSHFLIDIPPTGESPTSITGAQRLYNQAQMVLVVTNSPNGGTNPAVILRIQNSVNGAVPGNDPSPTTLYYTNASPGVLMTNLPFLNLTNTFYDQRETKTNLVTQIDVGRFDTWSQTNTAVQGKLPSGAGVYPTILYVADRRNVNAKQMTAVQLRNAEQIPANNNMGFSVATQNPLYTWGDYNIKKSSGGSQSVSTTNTANAYPSALLSDALTILSDNWTPDESRSTYAKGASSDDAADTTINAAIVTGTMPSTGDTYYTFSGGVHNLPRLLEDWSGRNLWLNTSILRLYDSKMATNQFRDPSGFNLSNNPYYDPPTRKFSFDINFLDPAKVPPGIPVALIPIRFGWGVPPPNTTTYTPVHN